MAGNEQLTALAVAVLLVLIVAGLAPVPAHSGKEPAAMKAMTKTPGRTSAARPWMARRGGPLAAAVVAATLAAAGCGGSPSGPGAAATRPPSAHSTGSARLVQFAQCMRSHGLPDFPDPNAQGTFSLPASITGSPQYHAADQACRSLAPPGALSGQAPTTQQLNKAVKFAGCMRKHGVPGFPDPAPDGRFQLTGGAKPIDPSAPGFKSALSACHVLLPSGSGFGTGA